MKGSDKMSKRRRVPGSPVIYAPPSRHPLHVQIWTPEQINTYLLSKYGSLNPDTNVKVRENA